MKVKDYLNRLKANRYTYYNLDKETKKAFQKKYNYLKRHKDKHIYRNVFQHNDALNNTIEYWLNKENEPDYIKKYKAMELISLNIIH